MQDQSDNDDASIEDAAAELEVAHSNPFAALDGAKRRDL